MIIKAKVATSVDVTILFYSELLGKSIYLNTYFFNLKFLNLFSVNMNAFYFVSRSLNFTTQNYLRAWFGATNSCRYRRVAVVSGYSMNFMALLFSSVVARKYTISKLI